MLSTLLLSSYIWGAVFSSWAHMSWGAVFVWLEPVKTDQVFFDNGCLSPALGITHHRHEPMDWWGYGDRSWRNTYHSGKRSRRHKDWPSLSGHLTSDQQDELQSLLKEFSHVLQNLPGRTSLTEHSIVTGSAHATRQPPYQLPHAYRNVVLQELREMEEEGIIKRSLNEWEAPIVLAAKKDSTLRFCVDYR